MSTMVITPEMLGRIAYVTGADLGDLYVVHLANVDEYTRKLCVTHKPGTLNEIRHEFLKIRESQLTPTFIQETLLYASLLRYNSVELRDSATLTALLRIESLGFRAAMSSNISREEENT